MATWLLNFVKAGTPQKKQLTAQARSLLEVGLWGIPPASPATQKLKSGDRVIAYVGAPEKVFIGDAVIDEAYHAWTVEEAARYKITKTFDAGISLKEAKVWDRPVPLKDIWPTLAAAKNNPNAFMMGAAHALLEADGAQLLDAGRGGMAPQPTTEGTPAGTGGTPAETQPSAQSTPALPDPQVAKFLAVVEDLRALDAGVKINEETTRAVLLNKYFDALGYSSLNDITYGEPALSGNFPDYVLKTKGEAAIAVEAKALGSKLGDKEAGQITGYCGTLGVRWGLLTDGRLLKLYDAHILKPNMDDRLVFELDLADYRSPEDFEISIWPIVEMLSKQEMQTGEALNRYAARELTRRILTDPTSTVVAAVRAELAKQKVYLTPAQVRALVEELIGS